MKRKRDKINYRKRREHNTSTTVRLLGVVGYSLLLLLCSGTIYSCATRRTLKQTVDEADRDPVTGVIRGTEALTLPAKGDNAAPPRAACLMVHGFVSARTDFADLGERLAEQGITVRMMRLPGHGTTAREFAHLDDGELLEAVRNEYTSLRDQFDEVYLVGFSMGGTLSTILASQEKIDRLVLVSPYFSVTYFWYYVLPPRTWNQLLGWAVPYLKKTDMFIKLNDRTDVDKIFMYKIVPSAGVGQLLKLGSEARQKKTARTSNMSRTRRTIRRRRSRITQSHQKSIRPHRITKKRTAMAIKIQPPHPMGPRPRTSKTTHTNIPAKPETTNLSTTHKPECSTAAPGCGQMTARLSAKKTEAARGTRKQSLRVFVPQLNTASPTNSLLSAECMVYCVYRFSKDERIEDMR